MKRFEERTKIKYQKLTAENEKLWENNSLNQNLNDVELMTEFKQEKNKIFDDFGAVTTAAAKIGC